MLLKPILSLIFGLAGGLLAPLANTALAQAQPTSSARNQPPPSSTATPALSSAEQALLDMAQAARRGDSQRLAELLPRTRGHLLEPWAHYWDMRSRLESASAGEIRATLQRLAGTYQEDRLRNDWLLLLGQRRDWATFDAEVAAFRMRDDRDVRCYQISSDLVQGRVAATAKQAVADEARSLWMAQREADDACTFAVETLFNSKHLNTADLWLKARQAAEANRPRAVDDAVLLAAPQMAKRVGEVMVRPQTFLRARTTAPTMADQELVVMALARLAQNEPHEAATLLDQHWGVHLKPAARSWAWGAIGRSAAMKLSPLAAGYFANGREADMSDEQLAWRTRAALRGQRWRDVVASVDAMSPSAQKDPTWIYWKARAHLAGRNEAARAEATAALQGIAGVRGFYEKLAAEELGQTIVTPPRPDALSTEELQAARSNPGLRRALAAIAIGLRPDGVREWNYSVGLHTPGGMNDRELLAAAQLACEAQVWDRCINTSERTKVAFDAVQRFPMPHREALTQRAKQIGLDASYVYGLIRQESRFITDARSSVGASGLMQVMPATARWTARKIGLDGFTVAQLNERDTNIAIGTAYLQMVLDEFEGSMSLAAAAYNAGPSRSRLWRNPDGAGTVLEGAIWAENVPFTETRDYVKKVLSNATDYAALMTGQPQSLKARLGKVGPRPGQLAQGNRDLP